MLAIRPKRACEMPYQRTVGIHAARQLWEEVSRLRPAPLGEADWLRKLLWDGADHLLTEQLAHDQRHSLLTAAATELRTSKTKCQRFTTVPAELESKLIRIADESGLSLSKVCAACISIAMSLCDRAAERGSVS